MKFQALRNFIDPQVEPRPLRALKKIQRLLFMFPRKGERFDKTLTVKHIIFSQILGMPSIIGVCGYMYQAFLGKKTGWLFSLEEMLVNFINWMIFLY